VSSNELIQNDPSSHDLEQAMCRDLHGSDGQSDQGFWSSSEAQKGGTDGAWPRDTREVGRETAEV
jgi:hypothetical protein